MIVTRELINKSIIFRDDSALDHPYTYADLSKDIDAYKNLLQYKYNATVGQSVLIGEQSGKIQLALVFACLELGLAITIVDYGRKDNFQTEYFDPKTTILLPIDFFILTSSDITDKYTFFSQVCGTTILLDDEHLDYSVNNSIHSEPNTILIKCTSSGTTGTPKLIMHTHEFIARLITRNSAMFYGVIGQAFNLSHGSSLATFFLPTLISEQVTDYINFSLPKLETILEAYNIDHIMLPYPEMIEVFIETYSKLNSSGVNVYSLTYIRDEWKDAVHDKNIRDIISFFGSNETSGPTLINKASYPNFNKQLYRKIDDFYNFKIKNNELAVKLPIYNTEVETKDEFVSNGEAFLHLGRVDLHRINGVFFNLSVYQNFVKDRLEGDLVFDFVRNEIYLAIWKMPDHLATKIEEIQAFLRQLSNNAHYISKHQILPYDDFLSGIKLDQELLREYFRRYV